MTDFSDKQASGERKWPKGGGGGVFEPLKHPLGTLLSTGVLQIELFIYLCDMQQLFSRWFPMGLK